MADMFKRKMDEHVGKGGVRCKCCNKYKGKNKKGFHKLIRKRVIVELLKELKEFKHED